METEEQQDINESIKLEKNTKGYNWSLRLNPIPTTDGSKTRLSDTDIDRLKMLNERMNKEFGVVI